MAHAETIDSFHKRQRQNKVMADFILIFFIMLSSQMLAWDWWAKQSHPQLFIPNATVWKDYGYHISRNFKDQTSCTALRILLNDVNELG